MWDPDLILCTAISTNEIKTYLISKLLSLNSLQINQNFKKNKISHYKLIKHK